MQRVNLVVTVLVLIAMGAVLVELRRNRPPSAQELAEAIRGDRVNLNITNKWGDTMLVTTVNWRDSNGHTHSTQVTSNKEGGESFPAFSERHLQEVEDFKAKVVAAGGSIL